MLRKLGVDPYGIEAMLPKMTHLNILLEGIKCNVANIVKQEMLSVGGDAAVSRFSVSCGVEETDVIIMGTTKQISRFTDKISIQPLGLSDISKDIKQLLVNISQDLFVLRTLKREIVLGNRTQVMGILNVTPDSFSDGGFFNAPETAVEHGLKMAEDGADFIDVGGESSRPGAKPVSVEEERARVIPVIKGLNGRVNIPISIDTTKAEIAREAIENGAEIVNDISAMSFDANMIKTIADKGSAVILMHMRGTPQNMQEGDLSYKSLMTDIIGFLSNEMKKARLAGIDIENIMIDPGIGFGKTAEDSMRLLKYLSELKVLGRPVVTGVSRKSFIGKVTGGGPLERAEGTAAAVTTAIMNGTNVVRVHDVKAMKKVVAMADAIVRA
ncbi:MAG TPA: dihydropteroate synthase [Syntrophales bacterium]|nr:dihydropteroate synthase [Syntrophales bacterium]